jgi:serine protease Do
VTLIVTNGHVVGDCIQEPVVFVEGRGGIEARILDIDWDRQDEQGLDLAILSVAADLPTFPIAREAAVGQWVMAAGSPVGLAGTVTFGAIANRRGSTIFTDAAIGPGNSGGPLFDARGRVIGTNKAVYTDFQGLSIADSIDGLCRRLINCS